MKKEKRQGVGLRKLWFVHSERDILGSEELMTNYMMSWSCK